MFKITVNTGKSEISQNFEKPILMSTALDLMGIPFDKPCGGMGVCKKCTAVINGKQVLLCQTTADCDTYIDYTNLAENVQGVTDGITFEYNKNPVVDKGYGAAIDIGTTTVACYIYEFPKGECIKKTAILNPQAQHGADVISRIMYANEGGKDQLKQQIENAINALTKGYDIQKYVVTGNTAMLHFFAKKSTEGIAVAPYTPETLFGSWMENTYLPPCISAYVGADITCAILSSGIKKHKTALLVDIGTNGEMALLKDGKFLCTSTAAGPAFEGAGISCGMYASSGAINKVYMQNYKICHDTINNQKAKGICGSAVIDAIAIMLKFGIIDSNGFLEDDYYIPETDVYISPEDVRSIQLAKSAIRSGIDALIEASGVTYDDIEALYIAGGFGSYINIQNAAYIGLIPNEIAGKTIICGNGAGIGASMILNNKNFIKDCEDIANSSKVLELATSEYFAKKYIDNIMFY